MISSANQRSRDCRQALTNILLISSSIHNLLLELVVLPNVLALALHQVNYFGWMDQVDHSWHQAILLLKVRVD